MAMAGLIQEQNQAAINGSAGVLPIAGPGRAVPQPGPCRQPDRRWSSWTPHVVRDHPGQSPEGVAAQARHAEVSGVRRTHYCGAYWGWGFHEDGVVSGLRVCEEAGAVGATRDGCMRARGSPPPPGFLRGAADEDARRRSPLDRLGDL